LRDSFEKWCELNIRLNMRLKNNDQPKQTNYALRDFSSFLLRPLRPTPFQVGIGLLVNAIAFTTVPVHAELSSVFHNDAASETSSSRNLESPRSGSIVKHAAGLLPQSDTNLAAETHTSALLEIPFSLNALAQSGAPNPQVAEPASESAEPATESTEPIPEPPEPVTQAAPPNDWQVSAKPYIFVPFRVKLDATVAGRSASIDLGLSDILDFDRAFDAGVFVEAQKGRFGLILNGFYVSAKNSGNLGVTFPAGTLPGVGASIPIPVRASADASLSIRQGVIDLAASYRAVNTKLGDPTAPNPFPRLLVSPFLGLRINILRQKLEVDDVRLNNIPVGNLPLPITLPVDQDFRFNRTSVEPLLGAQIELALSERWAFNIWGDVSGFNISADQNLTWNVIVSAQYNFSSSTALELGYRFNGFSFEDGEGLRRAKVDLRQNGVQLAVLFRF